MKVGLVQGRSANSLEGLPVVPSVGEGVGRWEPRSAAGGIYTGAAILKTNMAGFTKLSLCMPRAAAIPLLGTQVEEVPVQFVRAAVCVCGGGGVCHSRVCSRGNLQFPSRGKWISGMQQSWVWKATQQWKQ